VSHHLLEFMQENQVLAQKHFNQQKPKYHKKKRKREDKKSKSVNKKKSDKIELTNFGFENTDENTEEENNEESNFNEEFNNIDNNDNNSENSYNSDEISNRQNHSKLFEEFTQKLNKLVEIKNGLDTKDQILANESSLEKISAIDPTLSVDYFLKSSNGNLNNDTVCIFDNLEF